MAKQQQLINSHVEYSISNDPTRSCPVVWLNELQIVRELDGEKESLIRKLEFKRGMNVVWARPVQKKQQSNLFDFGLSGHAAGKSTMCRFIRFALGESTFGDETLRKEIRDAFPKAWVIAKVFVDDTPWIVCRPLHLGSHPFVVRTDEINDLYEDDYEAESFDVYRDVLTSASVSNVPIKTLPTSRAELTWEHVLPWITRDQDCHFDNLIEWRDKSSDSQSQPLEKSDRHHLLRAMLGLVSDDEHSERVANQKRMAKQKRLINELPILQSQSKKDRERLEKAFGSELPEFDDGLFREAVNKAIDSYADAERKRVSAIKVGDGESSLEELESELDEVTLQHADLIADLKTAEDNHRKQVLQLDALRGDLTQQQRDQLLEDMGPSHRLHCSVPATEAVEHGCPLYEAKLKFSDAVAKRELDNQIKVYEERVANALRIVQSTNSKIEPVANRLEELRKALKAARSGVQERFAQLAKIEANVDRLQNLAEDAESTWKQANETENEIQKLDANIKRSRRRQEKIREDAVTNLAKFSSLFDYFISALLGQEVKGEVTLAGRDLELKVLYRGNRRSSAIKVVKNLAFDLAALASSIEGDGSHPRFLIHDGPREADMSPDLYRKLFLLVEMIQQECNEKNPPPFQYIITTTEPPPTKMQKSPWIVKPIFDASDPKKRFLGVDL